MSKVIHTGSLWNLESSQKFPTGTIKYITKKFTEKDCAFMVFKKE